MLPLDERNRWMFVVRTAVLFYGLLLCERGPSAHCAVRNFLLVSTKQLNTTHFEAMYCSSTETKLCRQNAACCSSGDPSCSFAIPDQSNCNLPASKCVLSNYDTVPDDTFSCLPSKFYSKKSGFLLNVHKCLNKGKLLTLLSSQAFLTLCTSENVTENVTENVNNVSQNSLIGESSANGGGSHSETVSGGMAQGYRNISITIPPLDSNKSNNSLDSAVNIMSKLPSVLQQMGSAVKADITAGDIKGVVARLSKQTNTIVSHTVSGDFKILENEADLGTDVDEYVLIPKQASDMALKRNSSFAGVLLFPGMHPSKEEPGSAFLNNQAVGIEMGAEIYNLSDTVDIHFRNVDKNGRVASCRSWDGKGKEAVWITDGCQTNETDGDITCHCSHLTFFAVLLSPPPQNMSSSDFTALTYITSIGCGLSVSFLTVGLFMHCLIRKGKASQATKILMNLFVAMLTLNLSFLTNESIAKLGNPGACVAMAAFMHYTMLATFTWFFMQALHLYFHVWNIPSEIKHYLMRICLPGWVTPAVVVIGLLASGKYGRIVINTDDGNSAKMCWILDAVVHQGVNIGYYAVVFVFTFSVFIITVRQIVILKPTAGKGQDIKTKSVSILGLYLLLGITWGFAFLSHGPLLTASYYIFTILNSFQGFFLFIYYYHSSKLARGDKGVTAASSSTATSNTAVASHLGVCSVHASQKGGVVETL